MTFALLLSTLVASSFASDAPRGTDLLLRIDTGKLAKDVASGRGALDPLLAAWPPLSALAARVDSEWAWLFGTLESQVGVDLTRAPSTVTLVLDLDAVGGTIWAMVIRNANGNKSAKGADAESIAFEVDGHAAMRLAKGDLAWSVMDDSTILVGSMRGLQRQVRHLLQPEENREPLAMEAARLRKSTLLQLAFAFSDATRAQWVAIQPNAGALLAAATAGSLAARTDHLGIRLVAEDKDGQAALEHGVKAFAALARASTELLVGGAEALNGLRTLGVQPALIPAELDEELVTTLSQEWVDGFELSAKVRKRRGHAIDATVDISSYRGLVAAIGAMTFMLAPGESSAPADVEELLFELRRAQNAHKKVHGEYLRCGPVPEALPMEPFDWPADTCFTTIGFSPKGKVRYQLMAGIENGQLLLMARGDVNRDGIPEMWVLDNLTRAVRRWTGGGGGKPD